MKEIKSILAEILGVNKEEINDKSSPENIESWDSFNSLMIISDIEKHFGVKLSTEEIISIKNFGDIKAILKKHGHGETE